jgi:hypothetical protein
MKILLINTFIHNKNLFALRNYKNIELYETTGNEPINLSEYDCVLSPSMPIDVSLYPKVRFIFGPHFSVFPEEKYNIIKGKNSVYNVLCEWNYQIYKNNKITEEINLVKIPFGVDTENFSEIKTIENREYVFIYYKSREPQELLFIENVLKTKNITYKIFSYEKRYDEQDYLSYLQNSKYGIWLGRHESQGFALQEALSCNVPLFVVSVKSMNQEYRSNYANIPATTNPYWDERCGEHVNDLCEFHSKYDIFLKKLHEYKPREFILENLSMDKCEEILKKTINNISL